MRNTQPTASRIAFSGVLTQQMAVLALASEKGGALPQVEAAMNEEDLFGGFPVPPLIRFVGDEEAFLSNANGGPRIFLNIEDHQSYQTGESNLKFDVSA